MTPQQYTITGWQQFALVLLRFCIGWHLFYQGFGKIVAGDWSSQGYLSASWGPFRWIAESPTLLALSDFVMVWGLIVTGILLMIGLFTRAAAIGGILLLLLIYMALPPLDSAGFVISTTEGSELYVNKTFIEILALIVVVSFPTGNMLGLDIIVDHWRKQS